MYFSFQNQPRAFTLFQTATYLTFEPHLHSHLEIVFMRKGGKSLCFADNKSEFIEQGDLFISFPNQVHYYNDIEHPFEATLLIATPDACPEFKKYFEHYVPVSPIMKNADKNPIIRNALNILLDFDFQKNDFSEALLRGTLLVILSEFFSVSELEKATTENSDTTKNIIAFCHENFTNDISLETVSQALHISRYYVSHIFAKRLHISFTDYINSLRIRKACELLKSDKNSITEIAHFVGYNSVRTFDRCFVKMRGITPREYRISRLKSQKEASK